MESRDQPASERSKAEQWVYPGVPRNDPEETEAEQPGSATLCTIQPEAAINLCAQLESNGIPCERVWASESADALSEHRLVCVMVAESELAAAQLIRDGDEPAVTETDRAFEAEIAQNRIDSFICPTCNKRTLENLGLSPGRKIIRNWLAFLLSLPIILAIFNNFSPNPVGELLFSNPTTLGLILIALLFALLWTVVGPRAKHCPVCSWRSDEV